MEHPVGIISAALKNIAVRVLGRDILLMLRDIDAYAGPREIEEFIKTRLELEEGLPPCYVKIDQLDAFQ